MLKTLVYTSFCLLLISCGNESIQDTDQLDESGLTNSSFQEDTQFQQDIAAYKTVVNIIRETGLAQNFVILPGEVKNVVAYVKNNERILEYNPQFMKQLEGDTNWHGISVLAREIGHHLSNHELKNGEATVEEELEALQIAENMVVNEEISLQAACDWLEYKTDRRMSAPGLKKHIDKKYGLRSERLGTEPSSLLAR